MQIKSSGALLHATIPLELKFAGDEQPGTFTGYASVFNTVDLGGDMILKGAFRETLREWKKSKKLPPMLLNHGGWEPDSDVPIGVFDSMEEDETGLKFEAHLIALDTDLGKRIHAAMKAGALDGMSIGYRAREFIMGSKPDEPRRTLKKIDLVEVSVVTFPMNTQARVSQAKGEMPTQREIEQALRDAGLTRSEAKAMIAGGYKVALRDAGAEGEADSLAAIRGLTNILKGN